MSEVFERVLLVKPECFVYRIPPRMTNRAYRAADWDLTAPQWTGRLKICTADNNCYIRLEDKTSGELYAKCPVDKYPGIAVEPVSDSSRYFVIRLQDDSGRSAYIGIGFSDRADSFDMNVTLQDHFKWLKKEEDFTKEDSDPAKKLDLAFKEGQTIKVNINNVSKKSESLARPKPKSGATMPGILPPPPGGVRIGPPGASSLTPIQSPTNERDVASDLFGDSLEDQWGDFTSASNSGQSKSSSTNWVTF